MYRITNESGRVGHIAGAVFDGADGRIVTTVCGKTYPESELRVVEELDACSACDKKFYNLVDETPDTFASAEDAEKGNEELAEAAEEATAETEAVDTTSVVAAAVADDVESDSDAETDEADKPRRSTRKKS